MTPAHFVWLALAIATNPFSWVFFCHVEHCQLTTCSVWHEGLPDHFRPCQNTWAPHYAAACDWLKSKGVSALTDRSGVVYLCLKTPTAQKMMHSHTVAFPLFLQTHYIRNTMVVKNIVAWIFKKKFFNQDLLFYFWSSFQENDPYESLECWDYQYTVPAINKNSGTNSWHKKVHKMRVTLRCQTFQCERHLHTCAMKTLSSKLCCTLLSYVSWWFFQTFKGTPSGANSCFLRRRLNKHDLH